MGAISTYIKHLLRLPDKSAASNKKMLVIDTDNDNEVGYDDIPEGASLPSGTEQGDLLRWIASMSGGDWQSTNIVNIQNDVVNIQSNTNINGKITASIVTSEEVYAYLFETYYDEDNLESVFEQQSLGITLWHHANDIMIGVGDNKVTPSNYISVTGSDISISGQLILDENPQIDTANAAEGKVWTAIDTDGNGDWEDLPDIVTGSKVVAKTLSSDFVVNNETTYQDVTELTISVEANSKYWVRLCFVIVSAAGTDGFKWKVTSPTDAVYYYNAYQNIGNYLELTDDPNIGTGTIVSSANYLSIGWVLETSNTSGDVTVKFAQHTAQESNLSLKQRSFIVAIKMN